MRRAAPSDERKDIIAQRRGALPGLGWRLPKGNDERSRRQYPAPHQQDDAPQRVVRAKPATTMGCDAQRRGARRSVRKARCMDSAVRTRRGTASKRSGAGSEEDECDVRRCRGVRPTSYSGRRTTDVEARECGDDDHRRRGESGLRGARQGHPRARFLSALLPNSERARATCKGSRNTAEGVRSMLVAISAPGAPPCASHLARYGIPAPRLNAHEDSDDDHERGCAGGVCSRPTSTRLFRPSRQRARVRQRPSPVRLGARCTRGQMVKTKTRDVHDRLPRVTREHPERAGTMMMGVEGRESLLLPPPKRWLGYTSRRMDESRERRRAQITRRALAAISTLVLLAHARPRMRDPDPETMRINEHSAVAEERLPLRRMVRQKGRPQMRARDAETVHVAQTGIRSTAPSDCQDADFKRRDRLNTKRNAPESVSFISPSRYSNPSLIPAYYVLKTKSAREFHHDCANACAPSPESSIYLYTHRSAVRAIPATRQTVRSTLNSPASAELTQVIGAARSSDQAAAGV
ncbi:hypothetical protein B0H17DRAFT_1182025 [Mycena rosella]|uniref:Uncharacterized protein n=1 Tax=Mycena rosella TaxID=1033263 RepID=A0AAD7GDJ4_MYCRO|nr:hypothetical protein B0H17DRAFT_1182025 [Mycena rosella]